MDWTQKYRFELVAVTPFFNMGHVRPTFCTGVQSLEDFRRNFLRLMFRETSNALVTSKTLNIHRQDLVLQICTVNE